MFTETEKTILNALPLKYKYIFRSPGGELKVNDGTGDDCLSIYEFDHIFKDVKPGCRPICFREPILDDTEREYLKAVFKPFASRIKSVEKYRGHEMWSGMEYIRVLMEDPAGDSTCLPLFKAGTMYKGMKPGIKYTLDELDITYN
jgi:hypothetical protein